MPKPRANITAKIVYKNFFVPVFMIRCLHFVVFLLIFPLFSTLCSFFLYFVLCSSTYSPGFGNFSSTFFLYFIFYTLECIFLYFSVYFLPDLAEFSLFCCFPARCRYHDIISQSYCFCLFYFPVIYLCDDFKADGVLVRSVMDICCKLGNIFR